MRRPRAACSVLALVLGAAGLSCSPGGGAGGGVLFTEVTGGSGIDFRLVNGAAGERFLIETMVGGLGWIDYDGDGYFDLYAVNAHSRPLEAGKPGTERNRLYQNDGKGGFRDVTEEAGAGDTRYGQGVAVGDFDNDGDSDLFITNFGRNTLYQNDGGVFIDVSESAGLVEEGYSTSAVWFDMDRDGDLDLFVVRYLKYDPATSRRCREGGVPVYCHPRLFPGLHDLLYRNRGDGTFEEIGGPAGIARAGEHEGKGLGVVAFDFDRDGWIDIYVANDTTPNFLWRSNGDGTYADVAQKAGAALSADGQPQAGMGVDVADLDGDGTSDILVTNFALENNALYFGAAGGTFTESSRQANLGATYVPLGFGALLLDVDLDGDEDIFIVNGHINDLVETTDPGSGSTYRQAAALFLNDGRGRFESAAQRGGPFFSEVLIGRGLARCDFDNDGDIDVAVMAIDRSVILLRNDNPLQNRSVTLHLAGRRSPRDGYGARVEAELDGRARVFEYSSGRSYLSASDPRLIIGLAKASKVDRITVHWPSGVVQELRDVPAGARLRIEEEE